MTPVLLQRKTVGSFWPRANWNVSGSSRFTKISATSFRYTDPSIKISVQAKKNFSKSALVLLLVSWRQGLKPNLEDVLPFHGRADVNGLALRSTPVCADKKGSDYVKGSSEVPILQSIDFQESMRFRRWSRREHIQFVLLGAGVSGLDICTREP